MARITVEDCLQKEPNRFALVILGSKRTKQILTGATPLTSAGANKPVVTALREVAEGKVRFMTEEEAREEKERLARIEAEQRAATSQAPAATGEVRTVPENFGAELFKEAPAAAETPTPPGDNADSGGESDSDSKPESE